MALIPTQSTLIIGGRVFTDLLNLITLFAQGNAHSTFRKMGTQSGAGYQVTALKTLYIYAARVGNNTGGATSGLAIGQSDNDIGLGAATALTSPVYFGSESSSSLAILPETTTLGLISEVAGNPLGKVLAGKYVSVDFSTGGANGSVFLFGYEI